MPGKLFPRRLTWKYSNLSWRVPRNIKKRKFFGMFFFFKERFISGITQIRESQVWIITFYTFNVYKYENGWIQTGSGEKKDDQEAEEEAEADAEEDAEDESDEDPELNRGMNTCAEEVCINNNVYIFAFHSCNWFLLIIRRVTCSIKASPRFKRFRFQMVPYELGRNLKSHRSRSKFRKLTLDIRPRETANISHSWVPQLDERMPDAVLVK